MKVSVLMPTYNDAKHISAAIESVLNQKGVDIELVIVNDGSTDETEEVIMSYKDHRIKYIRQENRGQLDALLNCVKYVSGDFVCLFHSDDLISDDFAFERNVNFIIQNNLDGVYSDYIIIDSKGREKGLINVSKEFGKETLERLIQSQGSNPIGDPFFVRKRVFLKSVVKNYVVWNEPYWFITTEQDIRLLRLGYISQPWYKYRVFEENYARSDVGKFVLINGVLRTVCDLSKFYTLRFVGFRYLHRLPTKYVVKRKEMDMDRDQRHKIIGKLFQSMLSKYKMTAMENPYYFAVVNFYTRKSSNVLQIDDGLIAQTPLLVGKDVNVFYKMILSEKLPKFYQLLLNTASKGSFAVEVNKIYQAKIRSILKFLNFDIPIYLKGSER